MSDDKPTLITLKDLIGTGFTALVMIITLVSFQVMAPSDKQNAVNHAELKADLNSFKQLVDVRFDSMERRLSWLEAKRRSSDDAEREIPLNLSALTGNN